KRERGDEYRCNALISGEHRDKDEFARRGPVGELWVDMPLRHQRERAARACKDGCDDEVDGDDPVRRYAEILDAQIVLTNREAGKTEFGAEQNGRRNAGEPGGDDRDRIQHEIRLARVDEAYAEQARAHDVEAIGSAEHGGFD